MFKTKLIVMISTFSFLMGGFAICNPSTVSASKITAHQVLSNRKTTNREQAAKSFIAMQESHNNYYVRNGNYYGKYQLQIGSLNSDYSPANQEKTANQYVLTRYGSWTNAKSHWLQTGWY